MINTPVAGWTVYGWANFIQDLQTYVYLGRLIVWAMFSRPILVTELVLVLFLHFFYDTVERAMTRRFVHAPSERTLKQLAFVQSHSTRRPRLRCLP